ncbi:Na+/H+ antiporter [Streptacidiphilus sp. MAP12-20]|uniref:Na+/H+ antiporter n=1 Tax=Streptacidiphilus sp. MAP12-20 TaxID=3156299 RepID=UPI003519A459
MTQLILLFTVFLCAIVTTPLAEWIRIPQPVLMTVIGFVLALLPFVPNINLQPDLILPLVLPPLIYAAAQRSTARYFRQNYRVILLLAVALVVVTTVAVAAAMHWITPAMPVAAAVALGALISPPDPIAAGAVAASVGLPRRLMGILETEGLFNDVTALVIYGLAVEAVVSGEFSTLEAVWRLVLSAVLAVVFGVGIGWLSGKVIGLLTDATLQVALSLLVPFAAYVLAEELHGSGVLAVLVCSLWINDQAVGADDVAFRLVGSAFWDVVELLISGMAFGLIGLEWSSVLREVGSGWPSMLGDAALVIVVVVGIRFLWLLPGAWLTARLDARLGRREDAAPLGWRESVTLWWSGMRGVASVALALAIPFTVHGGGAFPMRNELVFIAFSVVIFTLLFQGMTLPLVVRWLGLGRDQDAEDHEERRLWYRASRAGLLRLKQLAADEELPEELVDRLKQRQTDRLARTRPDIYDEQQREEWKKRIKVFKTFRRVESEMLAASREEMQVARMEPGADPELVDRVIRQLDLRSER